MQSTSMLLFLGILPIILILVFVYAKDKNREPLLLLLSLFGLGIVSCFLVLKVSEYLKLIFPFMNMSTKEMDWLTLILYAFIGVALVEEFCKWIMVYFVGYHHKEFDELYDIIVYAVFVSLGFAFYENLVYVFGIGNIKVAFLRAISAVPGHACDAIFMGYYLSMAKRFRMKNRKDLERSNLYLSIFIPTILHGIYDFCLMSGYTMLITIFIVFVIYLYFISFRKIKEISESEKTVMGKQLTYCPKCGHKLRDGVCLKCGAGHK